MRVVIKLFLITLTLFSSNVFNVHANTDSNLLPNAKAGLLMEVSTGTIVYEKNIHEKMSVASMTKMMGMVLILEALEDGQIRLDEKVKVSKNASDMGDPKFGFLRVKKC